MKFRVCVIAPNPPYKKMWWIYTLTKEAAFFTWDEDCSIILRIIIVSPIIINLAECVVGLCRETMFNMLFLFHPSVDWGDATNLCKLERPPRCRQTVDRPLCWYSCTGWGNPLVKVMFQLWSYFCSMMWVESKVWHSHYCHAHHVRIGIHHLLPRPICS